MTRSEAQTAESAVLDVADVHHSYGSGPSAATVLSGVTFALSAGQVLALVGRSGSGKSTLCHLIAGLERPTAGTVAVRSSDGGSMAAHRVDDWASVAFLPQRLGLAAEFTVAENAFLPCLIRGTPPIAGLLETLGLAALAARPARLTSLGEQQRTGVARALSVRPRLAALDEPTGHQDDDNVTRVLAAVDLARSAGTSVVIATHDERVLDIADQVVRLAAGRTLR